MKKAIIASILVVGLPQALPIHTVIAAGAAAAGTVI